MSSRQPKLLAEERRREIVRIVRKTGSAAVDDLVRQFNVSAVTLRTDLGQLARQGALIRSHGGAVSSQGEANEYPLHLKKTLNQAEKARIARAAAKLIRPRQTVILDSGTTSGEIARAIKRDNPEGLTVITHALNIARQFVDTPKIAVIMLGGIMRHVSGSFVGPQAEALMRPLHADHFFLGIDGLDLDMSLSTPDLLEAQLNRLMIEASSEVTVVADASKLGRRSLSIIGDLKLVTRLITDRRITGEMAKKIRRQGVELLAV